MADVNGRRGPAPIIPQTPEQAAARDAAAGMQPPPKLDAESAPESGGES